MREAARRIGASLDEAADVPEALALLLRPTITYSHLLVPAGVAEDDLDDLLGLASEDICNEPLLLGQHPVQRWNARHVAQPSIEALAPILAAPARPPRRIGLNAAGLAAALGAGWLRMRFQPILDAHTLRPSSFEALARVHHPQHGILPPSSFRRGLADAPLSRRMFDTVLEQTLVATAAVLRGTGVSISVNIPLPLLQAPGLVGHLLDTCRRHAVEPACVALELIERHTPPQPALLKPALDELRAAGFGIAIDDAGPTQPHWRELSSLPFTSIKLDKSLVRRAEHGAATAEIIEAAHAASMLVVAEGIETDAIRRRLVTLGADLLQGFLFARPMPAAALAAWLRNASKLNPLPGVTAPAAAAPAAAAGAARRRRPAPGSGR